MKYDNGNTYEGNWDSNLEHGYFCCKFEPHVRAGRMSYHNGDIFEGQWKNGLRHGKALFIYEIIFIGKIPMDFYRTCL